MPRKREHHPAELKHPDIYIYILPGAAEIIFSHGDSHQLGKLSPLFFGMKLGVDKWPALTQKSRPKSARPIFSSRISEYQPP